MGVPNHLGCVQCLQAGIIVISMVVGVRPCTLHAGGCAPLLLLGAAMAAASSSGESRPAWSRRAHAMTMETLTDDEFDEEHAKTRKPQCECAQCVFKAHIARWRTAASLTCEPRVTWLAFKSGLGCVLCHEAGSQSSLGHYKAGAGVLKVATLKRHTATFQHQRAEARLQGRVVSKVHSTPDPAQFKQTWANVRSGKVATAPQGGKTPNHRKNRCTELCLAEAIRTKHREFLAKAGTISMNADGRQGRLLMCFQPRASRLWQSGAAYLVWRGTSATAMWRTSEQWRS